MLNKVQVITERGLMLELPLAGSPEGYVVEDIDGLDPSKATLISSVLALMDGEEYQASRGEKRQIIMKLGYAKRHADPVAKRRQKLYAYFMPKSKITLRFFMVGMPPVDILGVVEDMDAPMFVKKPLATAYITCHKPDFYTQDPFIFDSETVSTPDSESISYNGTVPSGVKFSMAVDRVLTSFTIHHNFANGLGSSMEIVGAFEAGDLIELETITGEKGAYLTRGGIRRSILYAVSPNSDWTNLYPGENTIRVYSSGAPIPYTIEYREKFGGL